MAALRSAAYVRSARAALLACAAALSMASGGVHAQAAGECVQEQPDGASTTLKNRCATPISVAYCPPQQLGMLRPCGDGGTLNIFYTDLVNLGPGESRVVSGTGLRIAACYGTGTAMGLAGFSSDKNGAFKCPVARAAATAQASAPAPARKQEPAGTDTITATATDAERACDLARNGFPKKGGEPTPCSCRDIRKKPLVVMCTATGRLAPEDRGITSFMRKKLIEFIERQTACDPDKDEQHCEHMHKMANPGGVRG